jgi:hypothetical protein
VDGGLYDASGTNSDPCVALCPGVDGGTYIAQDNCQNSGGAMVNCNGPNLTAPCMCAGDDGGTD